MNVKVSNDKDITEKESATEFFNPFVTKALTTKKHYWQYADQKKICQLGHCAGL